MVSKGENFMNIKCNFDKIVGKIKPMHAVGQPPFSGCSDRHMHYLSDAAIPYSRLHDVGGAYGANRFVDIPNIFRDFDADENDPASYDFAFTDCLLSALHKYNCEPIFRLGVTIENQQHIKAYRIFPPADYGKWARICEHIISHYNYGWADGFEYGIKYWEIWNEPDFSPFVERNTMWKGSDTDFFRLYEVAAKHLKNIFGDEIKVGGYASCGFEGIWLDPKKHAVDAEKREIKHHNVQYALDFFYGFFDHIKKTGTPIDFFSWHSYLDTPDVEVMADFLERELTKLGYGGLETQLNEWNNAAAWTPGTRGTSFASAHAAAMMCALQNKKVVNICCYYDARIGVGDYAGMFSPLNHKPFCTYYSFKAFGELYRLGSQVECSCDKEGVYAVGATDGEKKALLLTNIGEDIEMCIGLPENMKAYLIDQEHFMTEAKIDPNGFTLAKNETLFFKNY